MADNQHVKDLEDVRKSLVLKRRALAADGVKQGTPPAQQLAETQAQIEAVDRAITDEHRLNPGAPVHFIE